MDSKYWLVFSLFFLAFFSFFIYNELIRQQKENREIKAILDEAKKQGLTNLEKIQ